MYADRVKYFGNDWTRDAILVDQQKYFNRWPSRRFIPRQESIQISCDATALSCSARGILDYDHVSEERNVHAWGVATFYYLLKFSSPNAMPQILEEAGDTTERHQETISDNSGSMQIPVPIPIPQHTRNDNSNCYSGGCCPAGMTVQGGICKPYRGR